MAKHIFKKYSNLQVLFALRNQCQLSKIKRVLFLKGSMLFSSMNNLIDESIFKGINIEFFEYGQIDESSILKDRC
jgi:hypothetical protein